MHEFPGAEMAADLEQHLRAEHVGSNKSGRRFNGAVHMAFGGQMKHGVRAIPKNFPEAIEIGNVAEYKLKLRIVLTRREIRRIASVS
jgi:predicted secreted Zn-dependent protease